MTDEEISQEMKELDEDIARLADADKPLSKQERRRQNVNRLKKDTLLRLQQAREKNNLQQEIQCGIDYALLKSFGDRHPLLLHLAKIRLAGHNF